MEGNDIDYGPAKIADEMDKTKKALTERAKKLTLEQLYKMQKKMAVTIDGLEKAPSNEQKEEMIKEAIIGFISASNQSELEVMENKLNEAEKNI